MKNTIKSRYELLETLELMDCEKADVTMIIWESPKYSGLNDLIEGFSNSYADLTRIVALMPDYMVDYLTEDLGEMT